MVSIVLPSRRPRRNPLEIRGEVEVFGRRAYPPSGRVSSEHAGGAAAGTIARVDVLLVSPDERTRDLIALSVRSIERRLGSRLRFRAARDGDLGVRAALRERPDVIVADEIASRAGAFSLARSLRDDAEPYTGVIVILLDSVHDSWLAKWSGADAWFVKPVDPFELADRLLELVTEKESA
jgi:DNA-binding response OmpR family regulator